MSIQIFRAFLTILPNGDIDASKLISRECYEAFFRAKRETPKDTLEEGKKFYRVLTTHLSGVDGRKPFTKNEEDAILLVLRKNQPWPCFPPHSLLGTTFRLKGYHEKELCPNRRRKKKRKKVENDNDEDDDNDDNEEEFEKQQPPPAAATNVIMPQVDILYQEDAFFVPSLATQLVRFSQTFDNFHIDVWQSIVGIMRFVILARRPQLFSGVSLERAQQLCAAIDALHPRAAITILDFTVHDFLKRALAQNSWSTRYFGNVVGNHNKMHLRNDDLYAMIVACMSSYLFPGKEHPMKQTVIAIEGKRIVFAVKYWVDPDSLLLVALASVVEEHCE